MSNITIWQKTFKTYSRPGDVDKVVRSTWWQIATGLQQVDGLTVSDDLAEMAKVHIEGKCEIQSVLKQIWAHYDSQNRREAPETPEREADIAAARIVALLEEEHFQFAPSALLGIHRRIFEGVFDGAGEIRHFNIAKSEAVLAGDSVRYVAWSSLKETLAYDFEREKKFSYKDLCPKEIIAHLAEFTADLWQIHPFCEGNTRATAVFIIKYMRTLGLKPKGEVFGRHARYFRDALVRANDSVGEREYAPDKIYLIWFLENLFLEGVHCLNRSALSLKR